MINIWSFLFIPTILLLYLVNGQTHLYQELDDHDIRLTALEKIVLNLTTSCTNIQQHYEDVKQENGLLKTVVLNLTARLEALEQHAGQTNMGGQMNMGGSSQHVSLPTSPTNTISTSSNHITLPQTTSTKIPRDCAHAQRMGSVQSGVYTVQPQDSARTYNVHCDMDYDGGGWTTIQRRVDESESFERNWNDYKGGFGNISQNFWIGNDFLHALTSRGHMTLYLKLEDWDGVRKWAEYKDFQVGNEGSGYTLGVGKYTGTAGDSFLYPASSLLRHDGMKFSTPDRDEDHNFQHCGRLLKSGWWFNSCYSSNLNGPYLSQPRGNHIYGESWGQPSMDGTGIEWYPWKRHQYSFKYSEMKIRPTDFV
ncbi:fibrinogen-like protein 1 [Ylistrum balloti]|uniref:fibrinogen-like protein 1 n=1 Tax=Ylistrum balloti TaxID=509963 RepID=UPI00290592EB|nr:fibrinogen-like protein 1 [Ylistrum balloti]